MPVKICPDYRILVLFALFNTVYGHDEFFNASPLTLATLSDTQTAGEHFTPRECGTYRGGIAPMRDQIRTTAKRGAYRQNVPTVPLRPRTHGVGAVQLVRT